MEPIKCFLLTPTNVYTKSLRRYYQSWRGGVEVPCTCSVNPGGHHDTSVVVVERLELPEAPMSGPVMSAADQEDSRWPKTCGCGYVYTPEDVTQVFYDHLWRRSDNRGLETLRHPPVGAIWDATWFPAEWKRHDGHRYICQTPGGTWDIDSVCSNCTRPKEKHDCWVRHGTAPDLHVDKNGDSCSAGGGSILAGEWHGFLQHGFLVTA